MSQDPNALQLPYLLRDMLRFEHGAAFGLSLYFQTSNSVTLSLRGLTREGVFTLKQVITAATSGTTVTFRLPDIPIMVCVYMDAGDGSQGDTWVSLSLTANGDVIGTLCSGFVYGGKGVTYPAQNLVDGRPNAGLLETYADSDPAAGDEAILGVRIGEVWNIRGISIVLVTSATVANRRVHLTIQGETGVSALHFFASIDQAASTTKTYSFAPYGVIPDEEDNNVILIPIPPNLIVNSRNTLTITATNLQAGDNFGKPTGFIEKWYDAYF